MSVSQSNKVKYGLKNVHIAPVTVSNVGEYTYGTPVAVPGAVNLSLSVEGDTSPFYADNIVYFRSTANNGYTGDLEMALVPDWFKEQYLKEIKDSNGVLAESALITDMPAFALLFQFEGDKKAIRHVMYNCKASRPNVEGATKEDSISPQTETLSLTVDPRVDGLVKCRTTADTTSSVYTNWYSSVYVPDLTEEQMSGETDAQTAIKLSTLTIGSLTLTPEFSADVTTYAVSTENATNAVAATAAAGAAVVITVNGNSHTSGGSVTWETGANTVKVTVSKDGYTPTTYTVIVTKS